jgi:DNA primase
MEYEKISYVEALQRLADRYGIKIDWEETSESRKGEISLLYELHEIATDFYRKQLFSKKGAEALQYLKNRNFNESVLKQFSIGFASGEWDALFKKLELSRYTPDLLERSGLFIRKEGNNFYDRFRNRIMFPIKNISGRVIAFGGRAMNPDEDAKYLNSPETPIYYKSGIFYGLADSKDAIRRANEAILVEGYTDFLRFFMCGIENVVATSGTALTHHHARVIRRFASSAAICYDGDEAGRKASERAGFILLKEGLDVKVILLMDGEDPDSFLQNRSIEDFKETHSRAEKFISFYINAYQKSLTTPVTKTQFIEEIVREVTEIKNPVMRDFVIKEVAEKLKTNEELIYNQLRNQLRVMRNKSTISTTVKSKEKSVELSSAIDKAEYEILKVLISHDEELKRIILENINKESFKHPVLTKLAEKVIDIIEVGEFTSPSDIFDYELTADEKLYLSRLIVESEPLQDQAYLSKEIVRKDLKKLIADCIAVIITNELDENIKELRGKIKDSEKKSIDATDFVIELANLQKRKKEIQSDLRQKILK